MNIDRDNPPTAVWHVSRDRLRRGLGVQRIEPQPGTWLFYAGMACFQAKGKKGTYWASDCHPTEQEAREWAMREVRAELRHEASKYMTIRTRLESAQKLLGMQTTKAPQ